MATPPQDSEALTRELEATTAIVRLLEPLEPMARSRVLRSASSLIDGRVLDSFAADLLGKLKEGGGEHFAMRSPFGRRPDGK